MSELIKCWLLCIRLNLYPDNLKYKLKLKFGVKYVVSITAAGGCHDLSGIPAFAANPIILSALYH